MATIQIPIDDSIKAEADTLFATLGLDTSTAVKLFITAAIKHKSISFPIDLRPKRKPNAELRQAMEDVRTGQNLYGPFLTAEEAVNSMLED